MRVTTRLTPEQLVYIASTPPEMSTKEIAARLDAPYFTVAHAIRRIRRDGWICKLDLEECAVCKRPLVSRVGGGRRIVHEECTPARMAHLAREYRKKPDHTKSTKYVAEWRVKHPAATMTQREKEKEQAREEYRALPLEERREINTKRHEADRRDYAATVELADNRATPWTPDEDDYIMANLSRASRDVALELGRTLWGVRSRRMRLLRLRKTAQGG